MQVLGLYSTNFSPRKDPQAASTISNCYTRRMKRMVVTSWILLSFLVAFFPQSKASEKGSRDPVSETDPVVAKYLKSGWITTKNLGQEPTLNVELEVFDSDQNTHRVIFQKILGGGGQGIVYKGTMDGKKVAIKRVSDLRDAVNEAFYLNKLAGTSHVVKYFGHLIETDGKENTNVFIEPFSHGYDSLVFSTKLMVDLLTGLSKIHEANVVHHDVKPDNIMAQADNTPVFIDFGIATNLDTLDNTEGSPLYMSRGGKRINGVERDLLGLGMALAEKKYGLKSGDFGNEAALKKIQKQFDDGEAEFFQKFDTAIASDHNPARKRLFQVYKNRPADFYTKKVVEYMVDKISEKLLSQADGIILYIDQLDKQNAVDNFINALIKGEFKSSQDALAVAKKL